jgi:hypothetical protein
MVIKYTSIFHSKALDIFWFENTPSSNPAALDNHVCMYVHKIFLAPCMYVPFYEEKTDIIGLFSSSDKLQIKS